MVLQNVETISLWGLLYRLDPPPAGWSTDGWRVMRSPGLSLAIADEAIEIRGFGPLSAAAEAFGGIPMSLSASETVMWTTKISDLGVAFGAWRIPWPKREWLAISRARSDETEYTIALRPDDADLNHLRAALQAAGVSES
jgi:hypothetical protein